MKSYTLTLMALLWLASCQQPANDPFAGRKEHLLPGITSMAFGSCAQEWKAQPILTLAAAQQPGVFVYLGDNIYGDTKVMDTLAAKYERLGRKPEFQTLKNTSPLIATWDDHDFGWNDSGRHYAHKTESKNLFLDFWEAPADDVRRSRPGIYTSYYFQDKGHTVQLLVLDCRTFRDNLRQYNGEAVDTTAFHYGLDYWPHAMADSTLLGEAQWQWLGQQLEVPAHVRIIASSTQFGISWNGYEAWANFPHERERLVELIKEKRAEGVVFISGDVHYAEVSQYNAPGCYPLYDVTASGITSTWHFATPNHYRVAGPIMENHFGLLTFTWGNTPQAHTLKASIIDVDGNERISKTIELATLAF